MRRNIATSATLALGLGLLLGTPSAIAREWLGADRGKLLLTSGFTTLEGAGGGALAPWALITGYGSRDSWGANVHASGMSFDDLDVTSLGAAVGILDRVELSASRIRGEVTATQLDGLELEMDVYAAKVRVLGDAVYAQESWFPQIAVGAQFKRHRGIAGGTSIGNPALLSVLQLGAIEDQDIDYYVSATKIYLAQRLLVNGTLRYSRANQFGLLGFGGDRESERSVGVEATLAYLLLRQLAIGAEFRTRPDTLAVDREDHAWDAFIAWAPSKSISFVAGYANIGTLLEPLVGERSEQDGAYLSMQAGF